MATLPTEYDLNVRAPDPSRAIGRVTNADAPGRALAGLGQSIANLGTSLSASSNASGQSAYKSNLALQEFMWNEQLAMVEQKRSVAPGDVDNFAENWQTGYFERAKSFLADQPADVKTALDDKLFDFERATYLPALQFQFDEMLRATTQDINLMTDNIWGVEAKTLPTDQLDVITAKLDGVLVDAINADRLTPVQAEQLRWQMLEKVGLSHLRSLEGTSNPVVDRRLGVPTPTRRTEIKQDIGDASSPYQTALAYVGAGEIPDNGLLRNFIKKGGEDIDPASTAWCAGFVNAALADNGIEGTGSLAARSFLDWGEKVEQPSKGDIVVLSRGSDPKKGHVGFFEGFDKDGNVLILGGNQSDKVKVSAYDPERILGFRRAPDGVTPARVRDVGKELQVARAGDPYSFGGLPAPIAALSDESIEGWRKGNEQKLNIQQSESIALELIDSGAPKGDAYKQLNGMDVDPQVKRDARTFMDQEYARRDKIEAEAQDEIYSSSLEEVHHLATGGDTAGAMKAIPTEGITPEQRIALEKTARGEDIHVQRVYDDLTYLRDSPDAAEREQFAKTDLRQYRTQLGTPAYEKLINDQAAMRKQIEESGQVNIEPAMKKAGTYINDVLGGLGVKTTSAAKPHEFYMKQAITKIATEEIRVREANNGDKELTQEEVNEAVDKAIGSVYTPTARSTLMQREGEGALGRIWSWLPFTDKGPATSWTIGDIITEYDEAEQARDGSDYEAIPPNQLLDYAVADIKRQGLPVNTQTLYMALLNYRKANAK